MNIHPLPYDEREHMIAFLASGLGPRAAETLRGLSDGALRTCHESWVQECAKVGRVTPCAPGSASSTRGALGETRPTTTPAPELQPH